MDKLKYISLCFIIIVFASCKNDKQQEEPVNTEVEEKKEIPVPEGQQRYEGDFVFAVDAAVLTANNTFYAVEVDSMMQELNRVAEALKEEQYDAVNVVIHGVEKPNPLREETGEGWEKMITIKKIIEVTPAYNSQVIKTGGSSVPVKESK